jgi:hypothetical protein
VRKYTPDLSEVLVDILYDYEPPPNDMDVNGYYYDVPLAVVVDSSNNVVVGGYVSSWGTGAAGGNNLNWMIRKYDSTGAFLWEDTFEASGSDDQVNSLAVDSLDNVVAAGVVTIDPWAPYNTDWFVRKLAPGGGLINQIEVGGSGNNGARGVAVDKSDNSILLAGYVDLGWPKKEWDIRKYPADLSAFIWEQTFVGSQNMGDEPAGIAVIPRATPW